MKCRKKKPYFAYEITQNTTLGDLVNICNEAGDGDKELFNITIKDKEVKLITKGLNYHRVIREDTKFYVVVLENKVEFVSEEEFNNTYSVL